jgi:mRNA-degrading endonuclease RelE of RelBE toxin-antitoxin system
MLPFRIEYSPAAEEHLEALTVRQRQIVVDAVDKQLMHRPTVETKNRFPMRPNPVAPWELRIRNLRVYYDAEEEPERVVYVRAVGVKRRNRVYIGAEEIHL